MTSPPDSLHALVDRFDRDVFDMPSGRARIRLAVDSNSAWDLEVQPHRHRLREARPGSEPDAVITADPATWRRVAGDLQGGMAAYRAGRLSIRRNMHLGVGFLAATNPDAGRDGLRFATIDTKRGRVATMSAGSGERGTIMMLHGLGATKIEFLPTLAALAPDGWRVVAMDL